MAQVSFDLIYFILLSLFFAFYILFVYFTSEYDKILFFYIFGSLFYYLIGYFLGPTSPIGINLPNEQLIREQHGYAALRFLSFSLSPLPSPPFFILFYFILMSKYRSKSVVLDNIVRAADKSGGFVLADEFCWDDEEKEAHKKYNALASNLHTALHEGRREGREAREGREDGGMEGWRDENRRRGVEKEENYFLTIYVVLGHASGKTAVEVIPSTRYPSSSLFSFPSPLLLWLYLMFNSGPSKTLARILLDVRRGASR